MGMFLSLDGAGAPDLFVRLGSVAAVSSSTCEPWTVLRSRMRRG